MRLSEAIRLGAMLKPQGFGEYFALPGSCALGAAMDAVCTSYEDELFYRWPILKSPRPIYPGGKDYRPIDMFDAITELNDSDRWTRERIADWVESIEQAQDAKPVTAEAVTA